MKKFVSYLSVVILIFGIIGSAEAASIIYNFCSPEGTAYLEDSFTFTENGLEVVATGWSDDSAEGSSILVPEGAKKVHQCDMGLGVFSYDTDQHAVDSYGPPEETTGGGNGQCGSHGDYMQEILYLSFSQEVTINKITFTRVDPVDDFGLLVGLLIGDTTVTINQHISYVADPDLSDFITVDLTGFDAATYRTGQVFGISVTEGCDDFKVAKLEIADPVPEPGTLFLLGFGLLGLLGFRRKFN